MLRALLLASLIISFAVAEASAQTTPARTDSFSSLAGGRSIIIVDESGVETTGRLLRLTDDELAISTGGRDRTFARQQVAAVYERGDSVKNGAIIGVLTGAALGFAGGTQSTCGDFWTGLHSCSLNEKVRNGIGSAVLVSGLGAAIGAGIDALKTGRRTLYQRGEAFSIESFSHHLGERTVSVIDDSGYDIRGRLLLFTPDTVTVEVNGREMVIERKNVAAVYERGNSVKKGMIIGLLSGPALGLAAAATDGPSAEVAIFSVIISAMGVGVGAAIDAMIPGKRLIYKRGGDEANGAPSNRAPIAIAISPSLSRGRLGMSTSVSW